MVVKRGTDISAQTTLEEAYTDYGVVANSFYFLPYSTSYPPRVYQINTWIPLQVLVKKGTGVSAETTLEEAYTDYGVVANSSFYFESTSNPPY